MKSEIFRDCVRFKVWTGKSPKIVLGKNTAVEIVNEFDNLACPMKFDPDEKVLFGGFDAYLGDFLYGYHIESA